MKKYYYVYRITCIHNESYEKYYYGYRSCNVKPEDDNYWGSSKYVNESIKKYRKIFFKKKIIKVFDNKNDAIDLEIKLHNKFNVTTNDIFFNKCNATKFGYNCTGDILKGKTYEEIYGIEKAQKLKAERSKSIKKIRKNNPLNGKNNPNYGNKWSDDMKQKMSDIKKKNNPIKGSFWINNGKENKKISKDSAIPHGFKKGRIKTWKNANTNGNFWITNGKADKFVKKDYIIEDGWYKGRSSKNIGNNQYIKKNLED